MVTVAGFDGLLIRSGFVVRHTPSSALYVNVTVPGFPLPAVYVNDPSAFTTTDPLVGCV